MKLFPGGEMDLARLVLSRQSLDSLQRFPKLLRSKRFRRVRVSVRGILCINYDTDGIYIRESVRHGELIRDAARFAESHKVSARALFLRDIPMYLGTATGKSDVYMALKSDIPEVEEFTIRRSRDVISQKMEYIAAGQLVEINWTPDLADRLSNFCVGDEVKRGFLDLVSGKPRGTRKSVAYIRGCLLAWTGGRTITEKDAHIEENLREILSQNNFIEMMDCFVESGYLYPLIGSISLFRSLDTDVNKNSLIGLANSAVLWARKELFPLLGTEAFQHLSDWRPQYLTRAYIERVRSILSDVKSMSYLGSLTTNVYRIISGERSEYMSNGFRELMSICGIPSPERERITVTNCHRHRFNIFYDPVNVDILGSRFDKTLKEAAFRLGQCRCCKKHGK